MCSIWEGQTYAVYSRAKYHGMAAREVDIVHLSIVCEIEVVSVRRPLGSDSVNVLNTGQDALAVTLSPYRHLRTDKQTVTSSNG